MPFSTTHTPGLTEAAILVIDDQAMNVCLLELILKREGYTTVSTISDPTTFDVAWRTFKPDLLLLDLMMPELDGIAIIDRISRLPENERPMVLVLTGDTSPVTRQQALQAGIREQFFMTKPFHRDVLLARVDEALRLSLNEKSQRPRSETPQERKARSRRR
jgi:DNA-binding response OmpR family regulator